MAGFATDTTIHNARITLPDGSIVELSFEFDGVNPEPWVTAVLVDHNRRTAVDVIYTSEVLIDGITAEDDEDEDNGYTEE